MQTLPPVCLRHTLVLHLVPELLNAVQFRAVRGQKVKRESLLLQEGQQGLDGLGLVDGRIVQNDRQGSANAFQQETKEASKESRRGGFPELGREQLARRDQRDQPIQALSALGRNAVNLSCLGPCAPIGLRLCKASFIHVGQRDFAKL